MILIGHTAHVEQETKNFARNFGVLSCFALAMNGHKTRSNTTQMSSLTSDVTIRRQKTRMVFNYTINSGQKWGRKRNIEQYN